MIEPPPVCAWARPHAEQPESPNVGVEGFIPLLLGDLLHCSRVKDSGVVDQDIDSAKGVHCSFNHPFNVSLLRYIGSDGDG
jgi:hypothetical protein